MAIKGPAARFPHTLEVALTDEQWDYVGDIAALMQSPRSAVVRAMVEAEMNGSAARIQEFRREEALG